LSFTNPETLGGGEGARKVHVASQRGPRKKKKKGWGGGSEIGKKRGKVRTERARQRPNGKKGVLSEHDYVELNFRENIGKKRAKRAEKKV